HGRLLHDRLRGGPPGYPDPHLRGGEDRWGGRLAIVVEHHHPAAPTDDLPRCRARHYRLAPGLRPGLRHDEWRSAEVDADTSLLDLHDRLSGFQLWAGELRSAL